MEERQPTVVQRVFTTVTDTVFPGSRSLKNVPRERVLGTGKINHRIINSISSLVTGKLDTVLRYY